MAKRTIENVTDELNRWKQQRAVVQDKLDRLAELEKMAKVPRDRVEFAIEQGRLGAELAIIEKQIEPLRVELAELEDQQAANLDKLNALAIQGEAAWAKWLEALDALEAATHGCLALENQAAPLGYLSWPSVPKPVVLAIAQARQIIRFRESLERQRLEGIEFKAQRAKEREKPEKKWSAAGKLWDDLKSQLDGEK